jgi:hypothetical protein
MVKRNGWLGCSIGVVMSDSDPNYRMRDDVTQVSMEDV